MTFGALMAGEFMTSISEHSSRAESMPGEIMDCIMDVGQEVVSSIPSTI